MIPSDEFEQFPKIPRLFRDCTVTEKVDGTNAQLLITEDGDLFAGSRKRWLEPTKSGDNFGFARWAYELRYELVPLLGPGKHYGEWYGSGIGRGYGLQHKKLALFNTSRWTPENTASVDDLTVVPVLFEGAFSTAEVRLALANLLIDGSVIEPGFRRPEGVIVYHHALRSYLKTTIEHDQAGKEHGA